MNKEISIHVILDIREFKDIRPETSPKGLLSDPVILVHLQITSCMPPFRKLYVLVNKVHGANVGVKSQVEEQISEIMTKPLIEQEAPHCC